MRGADQRQVPVAPTSWRRAALRAAAGRVDGRLTHREGPATQDRVATAGPRRRMRCSPGAGSPPASSRARRVGHAWRRRRPRSVRGPGRPGRAAAAAHPQRRWALRCAADPRAPRSSACCAAGSAPTSPWSGSAASPPSADARARLRPAPPCCRATPRSSTRARSGRAASSPGPRGDEAPRGPVHVTGELLATKKVGAYRHLTLVAPGIAEGFRPGNFVRRLGGESHPPTWPAGPSGSTGSSRSAATAPPSSSSSSPAARAAPGWPGSPRAPASRHRAARPPFSLPKEPVAASSSGRGTPRPRCSRSPSGCASASCTVHARGRRRRRGAPALRARGPPLRPRGHGRHRRRLGRTRGAVADVHRRDDWHRAGAEVVYAAGPVATLHAVAAAAERARRLEPDRAGAAR